jgi:GNAT superfamily N-acetyltransferase
VPTVRELEPGEEAAAAPALWELRPRFSSADELAVTAAKLRDVGYRLLGSFDDDGDSPSAVAGFRVLETLAWGRVLYVDDLVTLESARGRGHGRALLEAVDAMAADLGCDDVQLDSGVGPERQAAHRRYFGHGMRITAYHFGKPVSG